MAPVNCVNCGEKLPNNGNFATCSVCHGGLHLDKCSIKTKTWNSLGSASQANWVCVACRPKKKSGSASAHNDSDDEAAAEVFEVSSLGVQRSILAKVNSLLDMKDKLSSIESSMSFLAQKYDALVTEVSGLREENKALRREVEALKNKETSNGRLAEDLATELAELNQYGRRMNLEIHGIKVDGEPAQEDLKVVLGRVAEKIKVEFNPAEIHQAHRLQARKDGKPSTILIQFHSKTSRDTWLQRGRRARLDNVFFGENLCPQYRHLLYEAKLRCKTHRYNFVLVKGGRIMVRRNEADNNVIVVRNLADLNKIK